MDTVYTVIRFKNETVSSQAAGHFIIARSTIDKVLIYATEDKVITGIAIDCVRKSKKWVCIGDNSNINTVAVIQKVIIDDICRCKDSRIVISLGPCGRVIPIKIYNG